MANGVKSLYTERQLDLISVEFDAFDAHNEYDNYGYLTQLLINAHILNEPFQKAVQNVFNIELIQAKKMGVKKKASQGRSKNKNYSIFYQSAPVKLAARCQVKAETGIECNSSNFGFCLSLYFCLFFFLFELQLLFI